MFALHGTKLFYREFIASTISVDTRVAVEAGQHEIGRISGKPFRLPWHSSGAGRAICDDVSVLTDFAPRLSQEVAVNWLATASEFTAAGSSNPQITSNVP
ncbi:MAG: hypothetical protein JNM01_11645 [Delftia acidovorans]|nr:hypothetical protein [Delftia acidovorans]